MTTAVVPCLIAFIVLYGGISGVDVYSCFAAGAKKGLGVIKTIFPPVLIMTVAMKMLEASGAVEMLSGLLEPVAKLAGLPPECLPLALIRPFSGAGALGVGISIMESCGVSSFPGRVAAVMLGSGETSFYVIGLYSSHLGITDTKAVMASALIANITAFIASAFFVRLLM
ncbi:MAG: nucleoside recognition domain-containing protein [Clostridiaceae bacterium]|nr:nucleoside recognition domain-containing protein [Clostridiaceae bacterium]